MTEFVLNSSTSTGGGINLQQLTAQQPRGAGGPPKARPSAFARTSPAQFTQVSQSQARLSWFHTLKVTVIALHCQQFAKWNLREKKKT